MPEEQAPGFWWVTRVCAAEGSSRSLKPSFSTVLGKVYELLGVLAEVHPSDMVNNSDKLYKAYLGALKEQVCL